MTNRVPVSGLDAEDVAAIDRFALDLGLGR